MGGWKLEVSKMALYMAFPVTLFYLFNQPRLFEDWVVKMKRQMYPPEEMTGKREIEEFIAKMKEKKEKELLKLLEKEEAAQKK